MTAVTAAIRTVGQLRDALAEFPDYYPLTSEVPPLTVETGDDSEASWFEEYHSDDYGHMPVRLAPVDIEEIDLTFTHAALEGTPPAVVLHGDTSFAILQIDAGWVREQCVEATAWAMNELRDRLLAAAEIHPHSLSRVYLLRALDGEDPQ